MLKIPFAIESCSGELVEVGHVKAGRDCGCVCPSCGQSVIARQGNINQWHFAHDSKCVTPPDSLCEISFYVCCKRFVIEQLTKNKVLTLSTPSYTVSEKLLIRSDVSLKSISTSMVVTDGRMIAVDCFIKDCNFDLAVVVGSHIIDVVLDHPERSLPQIESNINAVLLVNLKFIAERYEGVRSAPELIQQAVSDLFSTDISHKRWLFHPRELPVRVQLREKLSAELNSCKIIDQQSFAEPAAQSQSVRCKMCNETWNWGTGEPFNCKTCNTHLYIIRNP